MFVTVYTRNRAAEKKLAAEEAAKAEAKVQKVEPVKKTKAKRRSKRWYVIIVVSQIQMGTLVFAVVADNL